MNKKSYIHNESLRKAKKKQALLVLWLPIIGSVIAFINSYYMGLSGIDVAVFLFMFSWATLGLEVGFHRLFSHKAFKTSKSMEAFWWISGLMAGQGRGIYWIATHRRHHAVSDTPEDPHSPHCHINKNGEAQKLSGLHGLWHAHQGNTYTDFATNVHFYTSDILKSPNYKLYQKLDRQFPFWVIIGIFIPAAIGFAFTGDLFKAWTCLLWGGPLRIFIQHQLYFTNGSLAHKFGEKMFIVEDESRNNWYCAIWTFGSALQNTHHAFPRAAYLRQRWYELDIAGIVIRFMEIIGLVSEVYKPSESKLQAKRSTGAS